MTSDGEKWLKAHREEGRRTDVRFMKAVGIWFIVIALPAILLWLFALSPRAVDALGDWYFVWLFATALVVVPLLDRWLRGQ